VRTPNRKDFAVPPPQGMLLDKLSEQHVPVYGVGKIADIFLLAWYTGIREIEGQ
jgi:phosphopentomutase